MTSFITNPCGGYPATVGARLCGPSGASVFVHSGTTEEAATSPNQVDLSARMFAFVLAILKGTGGGE
ncbi:hypothetical protein [Filomicrobium insigne]|uniref:hypothetical protein n=1 Tax=Filomicrobium insigne TaxID=418854 RepID=UPI0011134F5C|nr:hypothetical protein [Filomicrobium insigne]